MTLLQYCEQPALLQACFKGDENAVRDCLLRVMEDVNFQDSEKRSILHAAVYGGSGSVVDLLIMNGARVNCKDSQWVTPLHRACRSGNEETVEALLRHRADINARDKNWQTPLHVAAANNSIDCARYLLPLVTNINVTDRAGRSSLHHATNSGHIEMMQMLLERGAGIEAPDKRERRAMHWAASNGHVDAVNLLASFGADLNCKDKQFYTPLHAACASGQVQVVRTLLERGADVFATTAHGNNCLHIACLNGQDVVLGELLDHPDDSLLSMTNHSGLTPLHYAAASTHGSLCLDLLLSENVSIAAKAMDGKTPLHMACIYGRYTRAEALLDKGAPVEDVDNDGNSALHSAARYGHVLIISTLLHHRADPYRKGVNGLQPVHLAALKGHVSCLTKLLMFMNSFDYNMTDDLGRTCLHSAACGGYVEVVDLLIASNCDVNLADNCGRTALHYAVINGHHACSVSLIAAGANIHYPDERGATVLHYAAAFDIETKTLSQLLEHRAQVGDVDLEGYGAAHYAALYGNQPTLKLNFTGLRLAYYLSLCPLSVTLTAITSALLELPPNKEQPKRKGSRLRSTPLHLASYHGHTDCVAMILKLSEAANIDAKDCYGESALHLAANRGHVHCCSILVAHGASVLLRSASKLEITPIHSAVLGESEDCLRLMLQDKDTECFDCVDSMKRTPLILAAVLGHTNQLLFLLGSHVDINAVDIYGRTALHAAAANDHHRCIELLVSHAANAHVRDSRGRTPFHIAAICGHITSLGALLMADCGQCPLDDKDYTPLHWACYKGYYGCVDLLLSDGTANYTGNPFTPLHCAVPHKDLRYRGRRIIADMACCIRATFVIAGNIRCVEVLLDRRGATNINACDNRGRTPLHAAAYTDVGEMSQLLILNGANVNAIDRNSRTPAMYAATFCKPTTLEMLMSRGADMTRVDIEGNTALHIACCYGNEVCALAIVSFLNSSRGNGSECAAIINHPNSRGKTPLHLASQAGLVTVVHNLLAKGANIFAVDENGFTPAVACAPHRKIADCLSLLIKRMLGSSSFANDHVAPSSEMTKGHVPLLSDYHSSERTSEGMMNGVRADSSRGDVSLDSLSNNSYTIEGAALDTKSRASSDSDFF